LATSPNALRAWNVEKPPTMAYGVEAYQSAWLKRYYPVEFMAGVLSNGKGFYSPLVNILECHRLGIPILPDWDKQTECLWALFITGKNIFEAATR
jgi:hypothetical protein